MRVTDLAPVVGATQKGSLLDVVEVVRGLRGEHGRGRRGRTVRPRTARFEGATKTFKAATVAAKKEPDRAGRRPRPRTGCTSPSPRTRRR